MDFRWVSHKKVHQRDKPPSSMEPLNTMDVVSTATTNVAPVTVAEEPPAKRSKYADSALDKETVSKYEAV